MIARRVPRRLMLVLFVLLLTPGVGRGETGYRLWQRYDRVQDPSKLRAYRQAAATVVLPSQSPTSRVIASELRDGLSGLLGVAVAIEESIRADGAVIVGTPSSPLVAALGWTEALARLGDEGYIIRSTTVGGHAATVIASTGEIGALYGAFHFLRLIQTRRVARPVSTSPSVRGSRAGCSITGTISTAASSAATPAARCGGPNRDDARVRDYARANASIGINGTVINSVNANPQSLTAPLLEKRPPSPASLRPYGIRVYLAANFAAPKMIGGLDDQRPARSGRRAVVARQGRRDLQAHSRLRRLRRQGEQRRAARAAGLRPHACRRRQRPRRRRRAARRHRDVAGVRLQRGGRSRSRQARLHGVRAARRQVPRQRLRRRSRTARSTSSRASRSIRCSARCRRRR